MQITLELPDEIARQLAEGQDLSRATLEALVAESCRTHRLSEHQAAQLLGLTRYELDGFLKTHGDYTIEDYKREQTEGELRWRTRQRELAQESESPNE